MKKASKHHVSFYPPHELYRQLAARAKKESRSISSLVRLMVEKAMKGGRRDPADAS